ncbi:DNA recombination protein RmuC [Patescibacteria group bacterium]|nr:DNA recombination protein RmuC [Patescibacteria group bacterium]
METQQIIIIIIITVGITAALTAVIMYIVKLKSNPDASQNVITQIQSVREELMKTNDIQRREVQQQLDRVNDQISRGLTHSQSSMQRQFEQTSKIIQDVTQRLTELDKTNKQVLDFSGQLQNLQNILKNPKQRGVLGEYWLETLLSNVLPNYSYKMQYAIGTDENNEKKLIADAAIFVRDQIIAIDAKFSLENYNRYIEETDSEKRERAEKAFKLDVKKRIDETSKYIHPELGTMNFAFMFIPAEGVYYNLLNADVGSGIDSKNLVEYAFQKHVMIVSPTSFYAYLQTVLLGLRELQLEKSTQEIIKRVGDLHKHFVTYQDFHLRLGKNLDTVVNQYNQSSGELSKISKDVKHITKGEVEIMEIETVKKTEVL